VYQACNQNNSAQDDHSDEKCESKEEEGFKEYKEEDLDGKEEEEDEEVPVTSSPPRTQSSRRMHRHREYIESSDQSRVRPPAGHGAGTDCECKEEHRSPLPRPRFKPGVTSEGPLTTTSPRLRLKEAIRLDKEVAKQYFKLRSHKLPEELAEKMRGR
jgi:hypothetical protein